MDGGNEDASGSDASPAVCPACGRAAGVPALTDWDGNEYSHALPMQLLGSIGVSLARRADGSGHAVVEPGTGMPLVTGQTAQGTWDAAQDIAAQLGWRKVQAAIQGGQGTVSRGQGESTSTGLFTAGPYQATPYSDGTISKISSMAPLIKGFAKRYDVPPLALAGSIAEEYDTRGKYLGLKGRFDEYQDAMVPYTPEASASKSLGAGLSDSTLSPAYVGSPGFRNSDIGAANVGLRTASDLLRDYPGEFPAELKNPSKLAGFVAGDSGNAQMSALYISNARKAMDGMLAKTDSPLSDDYRTALYVDYFRKGPEEFGQKYIQGHLLPEYGEEKANKFLEGTLPIPDAALPRTYYGARVVANKQQLNRALGLDD